MKTQSKTQKQSIDVTGLKIEDILEMDLYGLDTPTTKAVASRMVSAVNKRLRRLAKSEEGRQSPTYINFVKRGGNFFSIREKNLNQVRETIKEMRNVLNSKTSSLSGWKKIRQKRKKRLELNFNIKMSNDNWNKAWEIYNKALENGGMKNVLKNLSSEYPSKELQKYFFNYYHRNPTMTDDEILENLIKSISYLNRKEKELYDEETDEREDEDGNEFEFIFNNFTKIKPNGGKS